MKATRSRFSGHFNRIIPKSTTPLWDFWKFDTKQMSGYDEDDRLMINCAKLNEPSSWQKTYATYREPTLKKAARLVAFCFGKTPFSSELAMTQQVTIPIDEFEKLVKLLEHSVERSGNLPRRMTRRVIRQLHELREQQSRPYEVTTEKAQPLPSQY